MRISSTAQRFAAVVVAICALAALSDVASAATSVPKGMSRAEYQALALRSEALNERYRLGKWKDVPAGMTASEYRALGLRSQALNEKYGVPTGATVAAQTPTGVSHRFAFGAFGTGAAAMLGVVLLVGGVFAWSRSTRSATGVRVS